MELGFVGLGKMGRPMTEHLARLNIGTLHLINRSVIKPQSLLTHAGTFPHDIGRPKASSAGAMCKLIRPAMNVLVFDGAIERLTTVTLLDSDFILLASDNLPAEVCVGQIGAWLGKPLAQLSVHGETLVAQVEATGRDHDRWLAGARPTAERLLLAAGDTNAERKRCQFCFRRRLRQEIRVLTRMALVLVSAVTWWMACCYGSSRKRAGALSASEMRHRSLR